MSKLFGIYVTNAGIMLSDSIHSQANKVYRSVGGLRISHDLFRMRDSVALNHTRSQLIQKALLGLHVPYIEAEIFLHYTAAITGQIPKFRGKSLQCAVDRQSFCAVMPVSGQRRTGDVEISLVTHLHLAAKVMSRRLPGPTCMRRSGHSLGRPQPLQRASFRTGRDLILRKDTHHTMTSVP